MHKSKLGSFPNYTDVILTSSSTIFSMWDVLENFYKSVTLLHFNIFFNVG